MPALPPNSEANGQSESVGEATGLPGAGSLGLAHDLKSWLTPIRTCLQLWEAGERGKAEALRPSALTNLAAIMACLDHVRNQGNAQPLRFKALKLAPLLRRAVAMTETLPRAKGLTLAVQADEPLELEADEVLLLRLLTNLLANAVLAAPSGARIQLTAAPLAGRAGWVRLAFANPCASEMAAESVVLNDAPPRWGLGLRICREIAALHGGQMDILSTESPAAITVWVDLPGVRQG